ncbi:MAG: hypothetical protein ACRDJU_03050 [Actinomycetota bacterium]
MLFDVQVSLIGAGVWRVLRHAGPIFPPANSTSNSLPPGFAWLYAVTFAVFGLSAALGVVRTDGSPMAGAGPSAGQRSTRPAVSPASRA